MGIYAISDIHGCYTEFMGVLEAAGFGDADELYILGDIIDRGIDIDKCIQWCVDNAANMPGSNVHLLLGNHEWMAKTSLVDSWSSRMVEHDSWYSWMICGGRPTFDQLDRLDDDVIDMFQIIIEAAPAAKIVNTDTDKILLCHAGIRAPHKNADGAEWLVQTEDDLLWIGSDWYKSKQVPPFQVVSGHVPVSSLACTPKLGYLCPKDVLLAGLDNHMMHWKNKHAIDCGCVFNGNMGLLRLNDWAEFYVPRSAYL